MDQDRLDEVIVVDNGGGGQEIEEARRRGGVRVLDAGGNVGFSTANNLAVREASTDVVVFLNPDTVVEPGALAPLEDALGDQSVGIAMARLRLLDEPTLLNASGVEIHVTGIGWAAGYGEPAESLAGLREIPAASGTAMAMRRETFLELGGFADELFMYLEDLELGWRARLAGYRIVVEPASDVLHEYDYGRNPRKNYFLERNRLIFVLTAYSGRLLLLLAPLLAVTELGIGVMALREGWLRDKLASWTWVVRNVRTVARRRRATQSLRRVQDRDLARFLTATFSPAMRPVAAPLRAANPLVRGYWRFVRRAL